MQTQTEILEAAILGLQERKKRIDQSLAEVRSMAAGTGAAAALEPVAEVKSKHRMSVAGRRAISQAAKARWRRAKAAGRTNL
jgi:pyruvate/2-oxoglutarate/acetoin dehydrogenase E1 component